MAPVAQKWRDIIYFQEVAYPVLYAERVLGEGDPGQLSVEEASKDRIFQSLVGGNLTQLLLTQANVTDNRNCTSQRLQPEQNNTNHDLISIEDELKPALVKAYENDTSPKASLLSTKCLSILGCPIYGRSFSALDSVVGMIGNVPSNTSILILQGENDSQTPLEQGLLLQQSMASARDMVYLVAATAAPV